MATMVSNGINFNQGRFAWLGKVEQNVGPYTKAKKGALGKTSLKHVRCTD